MSLVLSEADVRRVLPMGDLIDAMQRALVEFSARRVQQPLRSVLQVGQAHAFFGVMPAFIPASGALGTKLVTVFGSNAERGLPSHLATILMLDSETGQLLAVMDGRYVTEARTAAVSAVSAKLLAREGAATLALIGSGVQARSHLEALAHVRKLREVRVWSPRADSRRKFISDMQAHSPAPIVDAGSARDAVAGADLVVLATASHEPVVMSDWIGAGTHICAVGACRPDQREMDSALVKRARVLVDSRTAAMAEAGDLVIPIEEGAITPEHIVGELGELAAGSVTGRSSNDEVTIFKSLGLAVEDVAAGDLVLARAKAQGLGRQLSM
ncbi:MAG TPA: ornithine cyclodeaminase family protein [Vicinamibacterales bacterium]|nr:ornithine cyclodeaminase family protein [Vicinamibacterales bacterium]